MANDRITMASLGWTTVTSILASLSILISVTYDWGFFFSLGLSYARSPTTIVDHVQSWLYWLPLFVVSGVGVILAHLTPTDERLRGLDKSSSREALENARVILIRRKDLLIWSMIFLQRFQ